MKHHPDRNPDNPKAEEQFKEATKSRHEVKSMTVVEQDDSRASQFEQIAELANITCDAVVKVRDLSVGPGNFVTPTLLADTAREVAHRTAGHASNGSGTVRATRVTSGAGPFPRRASATVGSATCRSPDLEIPCAWPS